MELCDNIMVVTFPTCVHQFMENVLWKAIGAAKLWDILLMKQNIDYPLVGKDKSKNPDLCLYAVDPMLSKEKDVWPLFVMEIAYADSCRKSMRDVLKSLLSIEHEGDIIAGLCCKVFCNMTTKKVTKLVYTIICFMTIEEEEVASQANEAPQHMLPFKLYAKPPHVEGQGNYVPSEGEHCERGTTYRMYRETNDLGTRSFYEAQVIRHGLVSNFFHCMLDHGLAHRSRLMRNIYHLTTISLLNRIS